MKNSFRICYILFAGFFLGCVQLNHVNLDETAKTLKTVDHYDVEVWQLKEITDQFWSLLDYSFEVQTSVADQIKIVTWSIDGDVKKSAFWLDCNRPKQELRRRIVKPAETIEKKDGSYEYSPAEHILYHSIVINSEGCGFLPPTQDKASPDLVRKNLAALFEYAALTRKNEILTYSDSQDQILAKFQLQ